MKVTLLTADHDKIIGKIALLPAYNVDKAKHFFEVRKILNIHPKHNTYKGCSFRLEVELGNGESTGSWWIQDDEEFEVIEENEMEERKVKYGANYPIN